MSPDNKNRTNLLLTSILVLLLILTAVVVYAEFFKPTVTGIPNASASNYVTIFGRVLTPYIDDFAVIFVNNNTQQPFVTYIVGEYYSIDVPKEQPYIIYVVYSSGGNEIVQRVSVLNKPLLVNSTSA